MKDKEFLNWLGDRIVYVYGENKDIDFLHKLRAISDSMSDSRETTNTASDFVPCHHWISVEDRLPKYGGQYLLALYGCIGKCFVGSFDSEDGFFDEFDVYEKGEVTHWMQIPELRG